MVPPGLTRFKESQLIPRPADEKQQFLLDTLENTRIVTPTEGGIEVHGERLSFTQHITKAIGKLVQQTLDGHIKNKKQLQTKLDQYLKPTQKTTQIPKIKQHIQTTLDNIKTQPKTITTDFKLPKMEYETNLPIEVESSYLTRLATTPLKERTFKQVDKHLTTQLTKIQREEKRWDNKIDRIQNQINKVSEEIQSIKKKQKQEIDKYLEDNFEELMTQGLTPEEQTIYDTAIQELHNAGIKINKTTPFTKELKNQITEKTHWKMGKRKSFQILHEKSSSIKLPEEYQKIMDDIQKLKNNPDIEIDPNLKSELKQLEATKRSYIKRNTPETIRAQIKEQVKQKHQKRKQHLEKIRERLSDKRKLLRSKSKEAIKQREKQIKKIIEHWYPKAHKQYKKPSDIIKTSIQKVNRKNFNNYNKSIQDEINYTKYSIFEGADETKLDDITEFYTDTSRYFNKYVNLKNSGATKQELDEIIDLEWEKEIWDTAEGTFKTDIKNKYRNIRSKAQLQELFEEMHNRLIEKAKPTRERIITFSAQNLEHYDDLNVGDLLPDTGFISTTLSKEQTIHFAKIQDDKDRDIALIEFCIEEEVEVVKILQSAIQKFMNEREIVTILGYEMEILERYPDVLENEIRRYDVEHFVVEVKKKKS